ncbi:MAG TPA: SDR family oxidoreductase [Phycisphaerae bacterium]
MTSSRRDFLRKSVLAGGLAAFGSRSDGLWVAEPQESGTRGAGKKLLILGGTGFLGPHVVEFARKRGHTLTLFNRGKTHPQLFPDIEKLHGDRNGDLKSLEGRQWDAVLDNSGYVPRQVRDSAELLKDNVQHYVFISTISVYADTSKPGMDESAPVGKLPDETVEKVTGETYGPLKALCEQAVEKSLPGRATVIRPGLIVGPGDPTDRFTYWPVRLDRGGEVLAPGDPSDPIQLIDVRDLAEWIVRVIEQSITDVYNATGPKGTLTMGEMLQACQAASKSAARLTWVDADFLEQQKVSAWEDMPVWLPPRGETAGAAKVNAQKAIAKGLTFRPIAVTAKDTLDWFKSEPDERRSKLKAGISPEREAEVLAAWKESHTSK